MTLKSIENWNYRQKMENSINQSSFSVVVDLSALKVY